MLPVSPVRPPQSPYGLKTDLVVKRTYGERTERRLPFEDLFEAFHLVEETQGKRGTVHIAPVKRLNPTLRTWLPSLTRRWQPPTPVSGLTVLSEYRWIDATWNALQ